MPAGHEHPWDPPLATSNGDADCEHGLSEKSEVNQAREDASAACDNNVTEDEHLARETPLPNESSCQSESVALDMDKIEVEEQARQLSPSTARTGGAPKTLSDLRQSRASKAASDAMCAHTSGAGGGGGINSNDYKMMAKQAKSLSKSGRLGAGTKSAYQAKMSDIGALGIGLQLYFMLTKYLSVAFLVMGLIALPAIILHNAGHGITNKMADPLQLAYASLGNEGVNDAVAADPKQCLPVGDVDCTWTTIETPFTTNPVKAAWIITINDCVYSIFFLFFCIFFRYKATQAIEVHRTENLTPAKYAVYVRGLPADATEEEILRHFNNLYDPTKEEEYFPLWFGCCWGRRRRVKHSQSKKAVNRNVVKNLDHLAGTTSITKKLYLGTWIAEVGVGHPTGGLLRAFLAMEALTQSIAETRDLISTLEEEKSRSPSTFNSRDEKQLQASKKRLDKLCTQLDKKKSKIKELEQATPNSAVKKAKAATQYTPMSAGSKKEIARAKVKAAAKAAKTAATNTQQAFNWDACECAFVVFNNLESRRRCLMDYRKSTSRLAYKFQPKLLRFRDGKFPLVVCPAPEPSNILWENLEVTDRGRFYRRWLTYLVTFFLLLVSAMIISSAQSAQQQFADKLPPSGLCETKLPQVFYGSSSYTTAKAKWKLVWDASAACTAGTHSETRYHIAYDNGIMNAFNFSNPVVVSDPSNPPERCVDPCVSEDSDDVCSTLPCFDKDLQDSGDSCETYSASHVLYCYCSSALANSITDFGYVDGPKMLWREYIPCRGYIKDFLKKNGFIVMAAAVVIIVNVLMDVILRAFADFERHYSESSKASGVALKLFSAQFLNTAIVVLLVNASLGLKGVPLMSELLKGKYRDFERDWYPTVGMGITTTMLINAFLPQMQLFVQMFIISPCKRELQRRRIRTQDQMNKLYAGPAFDISSRYPMLLNSVFVTMVFCGGSPILLFIAALSAAGTYWFDKLSLVHLYSVKTAYDEELGEVAISLLPWTLVLHLGFSTWMYGNAELMKSNLLDIVWILKTFGMESILKENPGASDEVLYEKFLEESSSMDLLGQYGLLVKVLRSNDMLIFLFFLGAVLAILLSAVWLQMLWPMLKKSLVLFYRSVCLPIFGKSSPDHPVQERGDDGAPKGKPPVVIPEFTDYFRKSVSNTFHPDRLLGFERNEDSELIRKWQESYRNHGIKRAAGQQMRTWEAMQAPTRSYAIETNEKYQLAVAEIVAASKQLRLASMKPGMVAPIVVPADGEVHDDEYNVLQAVAATDAVETAGHQRTAEDEEAPEHPESGSTAMSIDRENAKSAQTLDAIVATEPVTQARATDVDHETQSNNDGVDSTSVQQQ